MNNCCMPYKRSYSNDIIHGFLKGSQVICHVLYPGYLCPSVSQSKSISSLIKKRATSAWRSESFDNRGALWGNFISSIRDEGNALTLTILCVFLWVLKSIVDILHLIPNFPVSNFDFPVVPGVGKVTRSSCICVYTFKLGICQGYLFSHFPSEKKWSELMKNI